MERTAKLFKKGQNQAVMLPAEFAFDTESVYIRGECRFGGKTCSNKELG